MSIAAEQVVTVAQGHGWRVINGTAERALQHIGDNGIDLVFTDPPYARNDCVEHCTWMAEQCVRALQPGGSLVTLLGQVTMPDVIMAFAQQPAWKWRWPLCMGQTAGPHAQLRQVGVEVYHKPALWYSRGVIPAERRHRMNIFKDAVQMPARGAGVRKDEHPWQQSNEWSDYYIPALTFAGETVLDPFCGSGTFLISALRAGRRCIGFDVDSAACEQTAMALAAVEQQLRTEDAAEPVKDVDCMQVPMIGS